MIRFIRTITLLGATLFLMISIFYIDTKDELSLAHQAYNSGDTDQAIRHARRCFTFTSDKKRVSDAYYVAAMASEKAGKKGITKHYLDKLIKKDPNNPHALLFRGEIYTKTGNYENSIADFKRGFKLISDDISPSQLAYYHAIYGIALLKMGKVVNAEEEAELAISISNRVPEIYDLKSKIFEKKGDIKTSLTYCQKAYDLSSENDRLFFTTEKGRRLSDRLIDLKVKNRLSH